MRFSGGKPVSQFSLLSCLSTSVYRSFPHSILRLPQRLLAVNFPSRVERTNETDGLRCKKKCNSSLTFFHSCLLFLVSRSRVMSSDTGEREERTHTIETVAARRFFLTLAPSSEFEKTHARLPLFSHICRFTWRSISSPPFMEAKTEAEKASLRQLRVLLSLCT